MWCTIPTRQRRLNDDLQPEKLSFRNFLFDVTMGLVWGKLRVSLNPALKFQLATFSANRPQSFRPHVQCAHHLHKKSREKGTFWEQQQWFLQVFQTQACVLEVFDRLYGDNVQRLPPGRCGTWVLTISVTLSRQSYLEQ